MEKIGGNIDPESEKVAKEPGLVGAEPEKIAELGKVVSNMGKVAGQVRKSHRQDRKSWQRAVKSELKSRRQGRKSEESRLRKFGANPEKLTSSKEDEPVKVTKVYEKSPTIKEKLPSREKCLRP